MNRLVKPTRLVLIALLTAALLVVYAAALYKLQILQGEEYYNKSQNSKISYEIVRAKRGNILDRYGRLLVSSRSCNNLILNTDELFNEDKVPDPNAALLYLVRLVQETGNRYNDELPITMDSPFVYDEHMTDQDRTRLEQFLDDKKWDKSMTAVELMAKFRERYGIDNSYNSEEMRIIAGIRYALNMHFVVKTSDYIFVEDASMELITKIREQGLPGVKVETSFVREYHTQAGAHLLGYIRAMDAESYYGDETHEGYKDKGYNFDALVGIEGAEYAFEDWLHGTDGLVRVTTNAEGNVTDMVYLQEPVPGDNVYLTIDSGLQEVAELALAESIRAINEEREKDNEMYIATGQPKKVMELSTGGAVVIVDVKTSEPRCIASYPSFDPSTMLENYGLLSSDKGAPLFNRALNGVYAPGSTFKPVTGIAALNEGKVTVDYTIYDEGIFTKYSDVDTSYMPTCWIYGAGSHGDVNITTALEHSCNYYFYTVGDLLGIDRIAKYAAMFGLGEKTGIELPETAGHMATPEFKAQIYSDNKTEQEWFVGDTLAASIGQSVSQFTPIQLANYTAAIAGNGVRHTTSILKAVRSADGTQRLYSRVPVESGRVDVDQSFYDAVHLGMRLVVTSGNSPGVYYTFEGVNYTLAAKTGTAQRGEDKANNACFICYAPYEDPQIAIAVVVEKGGKGANLASIAKAVLDYYFSFADSTISLEQEQCLLK